MKQAIQEKYMELQMLAKQTKQSQKQLEILDNQLAELKQTQEALKDISAVEPGTEILTPIASGIFLKGKLTDNKEVIVNVGAGTSTKKTISEAGDLIKQQEVEIISFRNELEQQLSQLTARSKKFEKEIAELAKDHV